MPSATSRPVEDHPSFSCTPLELNSIYLRSSYPSFRTRSRSTPSTIQATIERLVNLLRHAHKWEEARQLYGAINLPVLVIYGDQDWSRLEERRRTVKAIPGA